MKKKLFLIPIGILMFLLVSPLIFNLLGLEFSDKKIGGALEEIRFFLFPICLLLILIELFKSKDKLTDIFLRLILSVGTTIVACFFIVMNMSAERCDYNIRKVLYTNKVNSQLKIVEREYSCSAPRKNRTEIKILRIKKITSHFNFTKEIDITEINQNEWIKNEE